MIVRNEERLLLRALESVQGLVDEIIIVDTGSTDRTIELAKTFTNNVFEIEWCNDFSAARNVSLEKATKDWVLVIDADEYLVCENKADFIQVLTEPACIACNVRHVNIFDKGEYGEEPLMRLFRRLPEIRYERRIHEQVALSVDRYIRANPELRVASIQDPTIFHTGYQHRAMEDKKTGERNTRLLKMALKETPDNIYLLYKLYQAMPDSEESRAILFRTAEMLLSNPPDKLSKSVLAFELLTNALYLWATTGMPRQALHVGKVLLDSFPQHPVVFSGISEAWLALGVMSTAARYARQSLTIPPPEHCFYYDATAFHENARYLLWRITLATGKIKDALTIIETAKAEHPTSSRIENAHIQTLLEGNNPLAALKVATARLEVHPADAKTLQYCAEAAEKLGFDRQADEWRQRRNQLEDVQKDA